MQEVKKKDLLRVCERARQNKFFVAWDIANYQARHGCDDDQIIAYLDTSFDNFAQLCLCKRPDPLSNSFGQDLSKIAAFCGVSRVNLARMLRDVSAAHALSTWVPVASKTEQPQYLLMAALDRIKPKPKKPKKKRS